MTDTHEMLDAAFVALIDDQRDIYYECIDEIRRQHDGDDESFTIWLNAELAECATTRERLSRT